MAVPGAKAAAGAAPEKGAPAPSPPRPPRPAGGRPCPLSRVGGGWRRAPCVSSVSIHPGSTAFTWMLSFAQAVASDFVSWTRPPLLGPYAGENETPKMDIIEPMLMILPPPAVFIGA